MGLDDTIEVLTARWPLFAATGATLVGATVARHLYRWSVLSSIPMLGEELGGRDKRRAAYTKGAKQMYEDGYNKFKDALFRITTTKDAPTIVVSQRFLAEIQKLPDDIVSMEAAVEESIEAKYTKLVSENSFATSHIIKSTLTPSLVRLNPTIAEEVAKAFRDELPIGADWTEININKKLLRIVAKVSGRIFIGPELCHAEEYIDASINYTIEVMNAVRDINSMNWFRHLRAPYLASVKRLDQRVEQALNFLQPVVSGRLEAAKNDPEWEKPDDMLQWIMEARAKDGKVDVENIARLQLGLSFAAIHTTTLTATNAFYNLAAMPEIVPELRDEIRGVLAESNGTFTGTALQKMKKLDSFLRETSRFTPPGFASFRRKVLKSFTLSNGQVIPAGVTIEASAQGINHDEAVYPEPSKFDAFRFSRTRAADADGKRSASAGATNQFVSVNQTHLTFGLGRHACPGRFFAANEIKMILANALLRFDVKNVDGVEGRIPNLEFGTMSVPDGSKTLLFREAVA
ncbi:hypothetical protein VUR80DRAFT_220 [Thermomyces stellatus]